jgi:hypothetical protein
MPRWPAPPEPEPELRPPLEKKIIPTTGQTIYHHDINLPGFITRPGPQTVIGVPVPVEGVP